VKIVHEPKKALSKEKVKLALEADSGHRFLGILANQNDDESSSALLAYGGLALGVIAIACFWFKKAI